MTKNIKLLSLVVFFLQSVTYYQEPYAAEFEAKQDGGNIVISVIHNYSQMKSYEDDGTVITKYFDSNKKQHEEKIVFRTYLVKPKYLRLQWAKSIPMLKPRVTVLLKNSCGIHAITSGTELEKFHSLKSALSAMAGVSGAVSNITPRMIFNGNHDGFLEKEFVAEIIRQDKIEGDTVDVVQITYKSGHKEKMWIDLNKLVVRRIEKSRIINGSVVQETVNFNNVKVDYTISSLMFEPEIVDCSRQR